MAVSLALTIFLRDGILCPQPVNEALPWDENFCLVIVARIANAAQATTTDVNRRTN